MPEIISVVILLLVVIFILVRCIRIVQQAKAYVIEFLGAYKTTWNVGLHFKIPFVEKVTKVVTLKEQVADFPPQPVITKDNVTMQIDTVVYFQITDPKLYTYGIEQPMVAIENLSATTLRNIIGDLELDQCLTSRDIINTKMRTILDEATDPWGIKVNRVELKNILPPKEIQNAMEKQMKAERERREAILRAEGEKRAAILEAEGEKESAILRADRGRSRGYPQGPEGHCRGHQAHQRSRSFRSRHQDQGDGSLQRGGKRQSHKDHYPQRNTGRGRSCQRSCRSRQGRCKERGINLI